VESQAEVVAPDLFSCPSVEVASVSCPLE